MRRYWIPGDWLQGDRVDLVGDIFHHIFDVCRQTRGSRFEVLTGDHRAHLVEVITVGKKTAMAQVLETRQIQELPRPFINLALSLPRPQTFDWVLEKSVEMGVHTVHPFLSAHSFIRHYDERLATKGERWQKIVRGATQQSGRGDMMSVASVGTLLETLQKFNRLTASLGLFCYEGAGALSLRQAIEQGRDRVRPLENIWVFVGSEGGFSEEEVKLFQRFGLSACTLGEQVLRVDTACLALISVIKYGLNLMGDE